MKKERKPRGMIFTAESVRAIERGEKDVTRRLVKPQPVPGTDGRWALIVSSTTRSDEGAMAYQVPDPKGTTFTERGRERETQVRLPYRVGDLVYVKEAFAARLDIDPKKSPERARHYTIYRADIRGGRADATGGPADPMTYHSYRRVWSSPMYMPPELARFWLRVLSVRVERLHDITEADAIREGAQYVDTGLDQYQQPRAGWSMRRPHPNDYEHCLHTARYAYANAWNIINGKKAHWDSNPFVTRIEFKKEVRDG